MVTADLQLRASPWVIRRRLAWVADVRLSPGLRTTGAGGCITLNEVILDLAIWQLDHTSLSRTAS